MTRDRTAEEFWAIATARRQLALWYYRRGCTAATERIHAWTFRDWGIV